MSWVERSLGEICNLITDGKHGDCHDDHASGYYFLSAKDIKDNKLNYDNARQIKESDFIETHRRTNLMSGDVLITNSGTIGRLAIAKNDEKTSRTTFQKSVAILKPMQHEVIPEFLLYSLGYHKNELVHTAGGAAQKNLLLSQLRSFKIKIPQIKQQKRIADLLSNYDDLIENNRRRIQLLEESARLLYKEWFVHLRFPGHEHVKVVDGVPEGWYRVLLTDVCIDIKDSVNPEAIDSSMPYIGFEHMPRRSITLDTWETASKVTSNKFLFKENDIIFGKIRPYFHKIGFTLCSGVTSSDAVVIRPLSQDLYFYCLMHLSSDYFIALASKTVKEGSKMPRADWKYLLTTDLLLPTDTLLRDFNEQIEPITKQLKALSLQNQALVKARDLLLPKLMSGEIVV